MKYIDLDQPSRNSARADSANGAIESAGPATAQAAQGASIASSLQQFLAVFQKIAGNQQQAMLVNPLAKPITPSQQGHKAAESAGANYAPWSRHEKKPVDAAASPARNSRPQQTGNQPKAIPTSAPKSQRKMSMASPDSELATKEMDDKSRKIVSHENKHSAILRDSGVIADAKPQLTQRQGPDGRKYAVAGEVNTDLSPVPGNPQATEKKAEVVYRSAIGNPDKSTSDKEVANSAMFAAQQSRQDKVAQNSRGPSMESPDNCASPHQPHAVKMRNPLLAAVGGAIVRGVGAIGGAIARGGGAAARGLRGANAYLNHRPLLPPRMLANGRPSRVQRFGASRMDRVTDARNAVVDSFRRLSRSTDSVTSGFAGLVDKLKNFSPALSVQVAKNNVARLEQNLEQGRRLGPGLAEFEKQRGRLSLASNDIKADLAAIFLPLATTAVNSLSTIVEIGAVITSSIASLVKTVGDIATYTGKAIADLPLIREGLEILDRIYQWAKQWIPKQEQDNLKGGLNEFFRMQIPGPAVAPDIRGPRMNMPLPQFNPLPFQPVPAGP